MKSNALKTRPTTTGGRAPDLALWALQGLLAVFFAFAGINKFFGLQQEMVDNFARLGVGVWFRYLVGVLELVGAIGLLIPRLSGLAAMWLAGVMVGAIFTHLLFQPPAYYAVFPAVLVLLFVLIARARWPHTRRLLGELLR